MSSDFFNITNNLLIQAILGGAYCKYGQLAYSKGYLFDSRDALGRGFLEYCYSRIFDIHRFPGYENYYSVEAMNCKKLFNVNQISESEITAACDELKELYLFTQKYLKESSVKQMTLYRSLRKPEIDSMCYIDGKIQLSTNILSSFSRKSIMEYNTAVKIKRKVNQEDILMLYNITRYKDLDGYCNHRLLTEEYEVWVLNRDKYGMITIDEDNIIEGKDNISIKERSFNSHWNFLMDEQPITNVSEPPCEYNRFSKKIIQLNAKKMNKSQK